MAKCDGCGAAIVWAETLDGKRQPFDREPDEKGNRVLLGRGPVRPPLAIPSSNVVPCPEETLYMPHHAVCPDAERFRSGGSSDS